MNKKVENNENIQIIPGEIKLNIQSQDLRNIIRAGEIITDDFIHSLEQSNLDKGIESIQLSYDLSITGVNVLVKLKQE